MLITLLIFFVQVKPQSSRNREIIKTRVVSFNGQPVCLRWRLSQILKQPGLRISNIATEIGTNADTKDDSKGYDTQNDTENSTDNVKSKSESVDVFDEVDFCFSENEFKDISKASEVQTAKKKVLRTIKAVEMDYEAGFMKITDHNCEVSDFSPVENTASLFRDDDDNTTMDGDLDSEVEDTGDFVAETNEKKDSGDIDGNKLADISTDTIPKCHTETNISNKQDSENISSLQICEMKTDKCVSGTVNVDIHISANSVPSYNNSKSVSPVSPSCLSDLDDIKLTNKQIHFDKEHNQITSQNEMDNEQVKSNDISNDVDNNKLKDSEPEVTVGIVNEVNVSHECTQDSANEKDKDGKEKVDTGYKFYGCFTPYGAKCRPQIYGYRGPLHVWTERSGTYSLVYNDTVTLATLHKRELALSATDFHQSYIPKTKCQH